MGRLISHLIAFAAGLFVALALTSKPSGPQQFYRTYHANKQVQLECPLDASGLWHGELREYHPSGRLRSVTNVSHGRMGSGTSYEDFEPDAPTED